MYMYIGNLTTGFMARTTIAHSRVSVHLACVVPSSLSSLPSGRSRLPMAPRFLMLSYFIKFAYPWAIIQSSNVCLGISPLPSILPSSISLWSGSPLIICPIQFRCPVLIVVLIFAFNLWLQLMGNTPFTKVHVCTAIMAIGVKAFTINVSVFCTGAT